MAEGTRSQRLLVHAEVDDGTATTRSHTIDLSTTAARIQLDRPPPVGSRIRVTLSLRNLLPPVCAEARVVEHQAATAPGGFSGVRVELSLDAAGRAAVEALQLRSEAVPRDAALRGLVVDDSAIVRDIFSYTFRRRTRIGKTSTLDVVGDAEQALELVARASYDFVIVDQLLPGKSGAELVEALRSDPRHQRTTIVGISVAGAEARDALLGAGADLYLNKPMEVGDLCSTLQTLAAAPVTLAPPAPRKKVLVVDDSPMMLELARDALEDAGYQPLATSDLTEMGRLLEREQPALILLDVQMPEAYGDDVANVLRGLRKVTAPVLLFSILDETELAERARAAEVDGYIHKGAGLNEMVRRVRALLGDAA
jgi:DNA-binding response OmpR family regulator